MTLDRRAFLAAASLTLALGAGPAHAQGAGITVGRAQWVVAPSPGLDVSADIAALCNGKARCSFVLAPATFGGKTPPGAGKHILLLQYKCGEVGKNASGYDAETVSLSCP
jgi:hypothetical protein